MFYSGFQNEVIQIYPPHLLLLHIFMTPPVLASASGWRNGYADNESGKLYLFVSIIPICIISWFISNCFNCRWLIWLPFKHHFLICFFTECFKFLIQLYLLPLGTEVLGYLLSLGTEVLGYLLTLGTEVLGLGFVCFSWLDP